MLGLALSTLPASFAEVGEPAWIGFAYVSLFSMLIGFVFWYRGLAQGGIAAVGQLQLLQPFFGLAIAATLLREQVSPLMLVVTVAVVACARRSQEVREVIAYSRRTTDLLMVRCALRSGEPRTHVDGATRGEVERSVLRSRRAPPAATSP